MQRLEHAPPTPANDAQACTESIKKGSLSFALASMLLSLRHRSAIHSLYSWCRYCDNAIDDIPQTADIKMKEAVLKRLRQETSAAIQGTYQGSSFVFRSLQVMNAAYDIPERYFHDLIDGMEMDITKHHYATFEELLLYCYRVAGVVGLMFSHIVGLRDDKALRNAVALGTAMQLTNIARDIQEDFKMGRVYLPEDWLREHDVSPRQLIYSATDLWPVVEKLLANAAQYYQIGDEGIRFLPWKAALAAKAARNIYADIGSKILKIGPAYLTHRTVISGPRKLVLVTKSFAQLLMQIPFRVMHPFKRCPLQHEWRYQ